MSNIRVTRELFLNVLCHESNVKPWIIQTWPGSLFPKLLDGVDISEIGDNANLIVIIEKFQTSALLRSTRILTEVLVRPAELQWKLPVTVQKLACNYKSWTWLGKGNLKRETESLLMAAPNNAIRTNYVNVRIDKTQQNSRCRLYDDRNKTINHIISECCKLAPKEYQTRCDWMEKVIHQELCKMFKFDSTNTWYMHCPESELENETYKILWNFQIQTDHLISAKRPDLVIVKKTKKTKKQREILPNWALCCPGWPRGKTERNAKRKIST